MLKSSPIYAGIFATLMFSGCTSPNGMFRPPSSSFSPAGSVDTEIPSIPAHTTPPSPGPQAAPYVLKAESAGRYINFSIYNLGTSDLEISKQHFAIISPNNRDVVPYNSQTTIIDIPQPAIVKPQGTIQGRAIFREINNAVGKRLVYKPDSVGTYADINRATGSDS